MGSSRRSILAAVAAATAMAAAPRVFAQQQSADNYPSHPVRLIVGFPPGSAADINARLIGDVMSRTLGQQLVVETRPGAGSSIAAELVARSPADGYTLFLSSLSNVTNAVTSSNLRFDFTKDLAPIALLTGLPLILAVHPSLGVSSVDELIALARSKPGELTYGTVGPGSVAHLAMELISVRKGLKLVHVPYPGSPPQVADLVADRLSMALAVASTVMPHVQAGRLVALASGSAKRPRIAPNIPTISEVLLPGFESTVWFGLMAPAGTPRPVIDKLATAANGALRSEDTVAKLVAAGFEPLDGTPEEFAQVIARGMVTWAAAAKAAGLRE
jgi:tripartite-type tricarboxylate transporter receptor subunit TctC